MSDQDFLKITIQNILQELSEIKLMVSNGNKDLQNRVDDLETRVTVLETKITTAKSIFTSNWFIGTATVVLAFIAGNSDKFFSFVSGWLTK